MKHHKYIDKKSDVSIRYISLKYDQYSVILNKDKTKYFESKVRHYYRMIGESPIFYDPYSQYYRRILLDDILLEERVRFDIDISNDEYFTDKIFRVVIVIDNSFFKRHILRTII